MDIPSLVKEKKNEVFTNPDYQRQPTERCWKFSFRRAFVKRKMQAKRVHWFENDVRFLLKLWKHHISELRLNKRNKHVYDVMATKMQNQDMNFTAEEIRTKIKNLTKRFRLVCEKLFFFQYPDIIIIFA